MTNGSIFDGVIVSPTNAYSWATSTYAGVTPPTTLMFSHEQEPCFASWTALQDDDLRTECIHRLAAAFAEIRRAFNNDCQFLLEPFPPNGPFTGVAGASIGDMTTADAITAFRTVHEVLARPTAGFPNGFYSLFGGLAINLYRRKLASSDQKNYMTNQVAVSRITGLPLHLYLSPREAYSQTFVRPDNGQNVTIFASQRTLDVALFAQDLDFALRNGDSVTIWDSKFYGTSTDPITVNGTGLTGSLAGNWGSGGVTGASFVGQPGMIAGYGPTANRTNWNTLNGITGVVDTDWWKHLIATMQARGYHTP